MGPRNLHFNKEPTACVYLPVRAEVRRMERSKGSIITRISAQEAVSGDSRVLWGQDTRTRVEGLWPLTYPGQILPP